MVRMDGEGRISELPNKPALPLNSAICSGALPSWWRGLWEQRRPVSSLLCLLVPPPPGASSMAGRGTSWRPSTGERV